jgi:hypothetical protein
MRKACIELISSLNVAYLFSGDLGGGKCLHVVQFRADKPSARDWQSALDDCLKKAEELKYEVSRIRGKDLIKSLSVI